MRDRRSTSFVCFSLVLGVVASGCAVRSARVEHAVPSTRAECAQLRDGSANVRAVQQAWSRRSAYNNRLAAQAMYDTAVADPQAAPSLVRQASQIINNGGWSGAGFREVSAYEACRSALRDQGLSSEDAMPLVREL